MKKIMIILLVPLSFSLSAEEGFNLKVFAIKYFNAWSATQKPEAKPQDLENYLNLLANDIGHQHYPYDPDDTRSEDGKANMLKGMSYYLGAHTFYESKLISLITGFNVITIKYQTHSKGIHPQTQQEIESKHLTVEVLEIENGKVALIRKYSE